MIRALYTAATGMQAQQLNIDVIANNLANVNTAGFKKSRADFQDLLYQTLRTPGAPSTTSTQSPTGIQVGLGARPAAIQRVFLQGDYNQTGNALDLAIEGVGFFQTTMPDGTLAFTRAGAFKLDNQNRVVNSEGLPMEPTISIPDGAQDITVGQDGVVSAVLPGQGTAKQVGQIQTARFANPATSSRRPRRRVRRRSASPGRRTAARWSRASSRTRTSAWSRSWSASSPASAPTRSPRRRSRPPTRCCGRPMRSSSSLVLLLGVASVALAAPTTRVTVAREASVRGASIRLGDVAVVDGANAGPLADLVLAPAPAAGETRALEGGQVLAALRRATGADEGLVYTIPPLVRVRRAAQELDAAALRGVVEDWLATAYREAQGEPVLHAVELPAPIRLPTGAWTARVVPPAGTALLGRVRLQLDLAVDGEPARSAWVVADVGLVADVVTSRRPVARGEVLGADDVALERRDLAEMPRGVLTALDEAVGQMTRTPLTPGAAIRREQLAAPAAVCRGDVVLLVAERGGLRLTAPGEVRHDAAVGEQVEVTNRTSRKAVVGTVLDPRTVAVVF
jgi:flagellar basal-body rod protein FlgG